MAAAALAPFGSMYLISTDAGGVVQSRVHTRLRDIYK